MPMYEYICYECGNDFEKLRRIDDKDSELRCPECGSARIERMLSVFAKASCGGTRSSGFR